MYISGSVQFPGLAAGQELPFRLSQSPETQELKPPNPAPWLPETCDERASPGGQPRETWSPDVKTGAPDIGDIGALDGVEMVPIG